jgi:hypothetical protein
LISHFHRPTVKNAPNFFSSGINICTELFIRSKSLMVCAYDMVLIESSRRRVDKLTTAYSSKLSMIMRRELPTDTSELLAYSLWQNLIDLASNVFFALTRHLNDLSPLWCVNLRVPLFMLSLFTWRCSYQTSDSIMEFFLSLLDWLSW